VNKLSAADIPPKIQAAISKAVGDFPLKTLVESGEVFSRYIKARKPPIEEANMKRKRKEIEAIVMSDPAKYKLPQLPQPDADDFAVKMFQDRKKQAVNKIVKERLYTWQPISYDQHKALLYLIGRSAEEYSVITRIFREIMKRDENFQPNSYFDFGSGVGSGVWAAAEMWKQSIYEYYCVDSSKYMNDLADLLLRDGNVNKNMSLKNVYYRQFLPAKDDKYDIVMSAYSLFELPNLKTRLETAHNLWNKAGQYLIFIESGTNAGFQVLNEIRDFLMEVKRASNEEAFVFSPCPHESPCPRFQLDDGTPCNFPISYNTLPFSGTAEHKKDLYSYLVIKKGSPTAESDRWPRIVRQTLARHKHVICRMCTQEGKLEEGIFTAAKQGKLAYKCARGSRWGDQLPFKILEENNEEEASDSSDSDEEKPTKK
jgi:ribosomal protein RSM22 (predicted rRNA methylase)